MKLTSTIKYNWKHYRADCIKYLLVKVIGWLFVACSVVALVNQ